MIFTSTGLARIRRHIHHNGVFGHLMKGIVLRMSPDEFLDLCIKPEDRELLTRAYLLTQGNHASRTSFDIPLSYDDFNVSVRFDMPAKTFIPQYAKQILSQDNLQWVDFISDLRTLLREMATFQACLEWLNKEMSEPAHIRFYLPTLQHLLVGNEDKARKDGTKLGKYNYSFQVTKYDDDRTTFTSMRKEIISGKPPRVMPRAPKEIVEACHTANAMLARAMMLQDVTQTSELSTSLYLGNAHAVPYGFNTNKIRVQPQ